MAAIASLQRSTVDFTTFSLCTVSNIYKLGCSPRITYTLQGFTGMKRARTSGLDGYFCGLSSWEFICKLSLCMDLHWISFCTTPLVRPLRRVAGLIRNTFHGVVCHSDSTGKQTALSPIEGGTKIYSLYHLPSSRSRYCHLSHHPLGRTLRQKTPLRNCHIFDIYKKTLPSCIQCKMNDIVMRMRKKCIECNPVMNRLIELQIHP